MEPLRWTPFERRVIRLTLAAAPLMAVSATLAMLMSPKQFAESDTATGWGLWFGAVLGLAMVLVLYVLPQVFFGRALRSATYTRVTATAIASPLWVFLGLQPLVAALIGGWAGLAPLAVVTAAVAGVLDCLVFIVALRGRSRLRPPFRAATHRP